MTRLLGISGALRKASTNTDCSATGTKANKGRRPGKVLPKRGPMSQSRCS